MTQENPGILKLNWERRGDFLPLSREEIKEAVANYTSERVDSYEPLSQGCVNSNYKITLSNGIDLVLRVYMQESGYLAREAHIHALIQDKVPVARFLHLNEEKRIIPYPFAIMEYKEGILFRDLILAGDQEAIASCAYQTGQILTRISSYHFEKAGFFEDDLKVKPFKKDQTFSRYLRSLLLKPRLKEVLGKSLVHDLQTLIEVNDQTLLDLSQHATLTHADYDPANILVKKENNEWKISAILDWEFAFSSTVYLDMGLMLRFAHKLPPSFQMSFIQGIQDANPQLLEQDWERRTKLADFVSLLSLCEDNSPQERPQMFRDIKGLLQHSCEVLAES